MSEKGTRLRTSRALAAYLPAALSVVLGACLYITFSVGQWRSLTVPSWDLAIFTEAAKSYSHFSAPIVPVKGPGYNLLGDHFHPILVLLGLVYRFFPSGLTLLVVQDLLIAVSAWPLVRLASKQAGWLLGSFVGIGYVTAWGFQGAVASQFHEIAFAVPLLAWASAAFVEGRWVAVMAWSAPLVLVKEDLGLTVMMIGLVLAWRGRENEKSFTYPLFFAVFGLLAFFVTVKLLLPAFNASGTWAYSLDGSSNRGGVTLIERALWPAQKYGVIAMVILGAGIIGMASPWFWVIMPTIAWRFLGSVDYYWDWKHWHYNAILIPILLGALLDVHRRWSSQEDSSISRGWGWVTSTQRPLVATIALALPCAAAFVTAPQLPMWQMTNPGFGAVSPRMAQVEEINSLIPENANVETDLTLLAYLIPDHEVYWVGSAKGVAVDYVVVDQRGAAWGDQKNVEAVSYAQGAHPGSTYKLIYNSGGFQVAQRVN